MRSNEEMHEHTAAGFSKVKKLITVLRKCNGKSVVSDDGSGLISPRAARILFYIGIAAAAVAIFAGAYFIQPTTGDFIRAESLTQMLMLAILVMSFVVAIKDTVNVLYMTDDLEQLLPMPFSAVQIVLAKLAVVAIFPVTLSVIILNGICLGYGIREGAGATYIIGVVISSILLPVTGIAAAALLIVLLFRLFGFIRNRDITVAAGGIFAFALSMAYIYISNGLRGDNADGAAAALGIMSSVSSVFPNISFMNRFMFEGSIAGLLISLAIPAALITLTAFAVRAFYFNTALSMRSTGTGKKAVSREMLHNRKKYTAAGALTFYEAKSARRNPAYLIYGFVVSFLWPAFFVIPLLLNSSGMFDRVQLPLGTIEALLAFTSLSAAASCFACGFNILPGTAFSREGASFSALRALPIDYRDYCRSKRSFILRLCACGSVAYVIAAGIVALATGFISFKCLWMIPASACVSFLLDMIFINLLIYKDSIKPQLDWESETELSRKLGIINIILIIAGVVLFMIFMLSLAFGPLLEVDPAPGIIMTACAAVCLAAVILAPVTNKLATAAAAKNLMKLE